MIRSQAADALGMLGTKAVSAIPELSLLVAGDCEVVALNASYGLGRMGLEGVEALLGIISEGSKLAAERAAYGLQSAGEIAIPGLLALLDHPDDKRRALAVFVLGMMGPRATEAVPSLIRCLQDESEWVQRNAIESLGMIGQPSSEVVSALTQVLDRTIQTDWIEDAPPVDLYAYDKFQPWIHNKNGYTAALSLLRTTNADEAANVVNVLEKALFDHDRYVRAYAFEALSHIRTKEAVDVIIRHARSSRWCPDTSKLSTF